MKKLLNLGFVTSLIVFILLIPISNAEDSYDFNDADTYEYIKFLSNNNVCGEINEDANFYIYKFSISDSNILKKLYPTEFQEGLVKKELSFLIPIKKDNSINDLNRRYDDIDGISMATSSAPYMKNWSIVGNQFYNPMDGTPYKIEGPANFEVEVTTTSHYKISGYVNANIKGIIEGKIGGYSGQSQSIKWRIDVNVPNGYYEKIQVWEYLNKYSFDIFKNRKYISSGSAYKPNGGLKIENNLYRKK